jgi:uncharacterized membrane protein YfhO
LKDYQAGNKGYTLTYELDREIDAVIPIAVLDGIQVLLDGKPYSISKYENLIQMKLPAGNHKIDIMFERTDIYNWGMGLSILCAIALISILVFFRKRKKCEDEL